MSQSDVKIYPYKEILYTRIQQFKALSESDKIIKKSLWNLVGPFLVCTNQKSITAATALFFESSNLGNETLISISHRYDYNAKQAIWFDSPACTLIKYLENVYNPQIINNDNGKGIVLISNTNIPGELKIAFWP